MKNVSVMVLIIILGLFVSSCVKGVTPADCTDPYIFVKDECCLDRNVNGQCDYADSQTGEGSSSGDKETSSPSQSGTTPLSDAEQKALEERKQIMEEAKTGFPSKDELLGYFPDWFDGQQYPVYPSKYYKYTDDYNFQPRKGFAGFNRSIVLQGKQCHVTDLRTFIPTDEMVYFWRPLPIPCEEIEDCNLYAAKDPALKYLVMGNAVYTCKPYSKSCCE